MRIWYLSGSEVASTAANSVHVMKMSAALARAGHDVTLYAWRGPVDQDPFAYYGVDRSFGLARAPRWGVPGGGTLAFLLRLQRDLYRSGPPELVYGRNLRAVSWAARHGPPTMLEVHNPPRNAAEERSLKRLSLRENFLGLVVISDALRSEYERTRPYLRGRVLVAPDGADPVDHGMSPGSSPPRATARLQVGYVGQLYPGKGMELIVRLGAACPGMDFHVVGGTRDQIDRWRAELGRAGGTERNTTFHGHVAHGDLHRCYARFDVFLAPYQPTVHGVGGDRDLARWMSPLKIFEYMAASRPIICSDLPVLREVLEDGRDALLVPPTDAASWIRALSRLDGSADLRERLSTRALERFLARYTWESRARAVMAFAERAQRRGQPFAAAP